jgi:uncharacterized MAPEG superfamily protein
MHSATMTFAFWCVFAVLLAPYIFAVLSRWGTAKQDYVGDPRSFNERLSGWRRRAHLAQLNAFESFPAFAVAVIIAQLVHVPQPRIDAAAGAFVALRALHGASYLADRPAIRSTAWQGGMLCIVLLFVLSGVSSCQQ